MLYGGSNLGENNFGKIQFITISKTFFIIFLRNPMWIGDIMGGRETEVFVEGSFSPMERIVLSANGNLQRIMRYVKLFYGE